MTTSNFYFVDFYCLLHFTGIILHTEIFFLFSTIQNSYCSVHMRFFTRQTENFHISNSTHFSSFLSYLSSQSIVAQLTPVRSLQRPIYWRLWILYNKASINKSFIMTHTTEWSIRYNTCKFRYRVRRAIISKTTCTASNIILMNACLK